MYASNWRRLRERLLDGLEIIADCGRGWDEVLLEQVIYIHRKDGRAQSYRNLTRAEPSFRFLGNVDKRECRRFEFYVNDVSEEALHVARKVRASGRFLGELVTNVRGAGLQRQLTKYKRGATVIGGRSLKRYYLSESAGYYDSNDIPEKARVRVGNVLVQNIITRRRLVSHIVQPNEAEKLILDSVNQIELQTEKISSSFIVALLNSKLLNWYVYQFIFAGASLTMHFDNPVTSRIPLPDYAAQPNLVENIIAEVKRIYANRHANEKTSQARIDKYIFQLYGLSPAQIALVEADMP